MAKPLTPTSPGVLHRLRPVFRLAALVALVFSLVPAAGRQGPTQAPPVPAFREARRVAVIPIRGVIDFSRSGTSVAFTSLERRIGLATRAGADALVFEIDIEGGNASAAARMAELIRDAPVANTVAWVNRRAEGPGVLLALACREIVLGEGASIGPVTGSDGDGRRRARREENRAAVLLGSMLSSIRTHNERFPGSPRDEYLFMAMIDPTIRLWWVSEGASGAKAAIDEREARRLLQLPAATPLPPDSGMEGVPIGSPLLASIYPDARPLLYDASGAPVFDRSGNPVYATSSRPAQLTDPGAVWRLVRPVNQGEAPARLSGQDLQEFGLIANNPDGAGGHVPVVSDEDIRAFFGATHVRRMERAWSEGLVLFLTTPMVRGILIAIFLVSMVLEMTHPGAILPGAVSLLTLLLLVAPPLLIGMADWWEIAAIIVGVVLILLEVAVLPGFGVPGALGLLLLFGGLLATFLPVGQGVFPNSPTEQADLLWGLVTILLAIFTAALGLGIIFQNLGRVPLLKRLVLRNPGFNEQDEEFLDQAIAENEPPAEVGDSGVTLTPMRPAGRIDIAGREVDAVAAIGYIDSGVRVVVVAVDGVKVSVEPADTTTTASPGGHTPA